VRAELYELDTEIGTNFYDEVIGPEFRSAARGVFARHSYLDLMKRNEQVEMRWSAICAGASPASTWKSPR